jgi:predicted CoA-binding protein
MTPSRPAVAAQVRYGTDDTIRDLLVDTTTWAVVGLSANTARTAYHIADYLREHGKRVIPVHPSAPTIAGEPGYPRVVDIPFPVDVVDVFVRSELAGAVVDDAIAAGAGAVWLQLGVRDDEAAARAERAGLRVVMDTCPKIEAPRLLGAWQAVHGS